MTTSTMSLINQDSEFYPRGLLNLGDEAPEVLWVRGNVEILRGLRHSVTFTGSRAVTGYGEHVTREMVGDLHDSGATVVTGGGYGVEAAAMRSALDHDIPTVVWLASGVDRLYPSGNLDLLERVASEGVIISTEENGATPTKLRLMQRNRLMGVTTGATVVVEAGVNSGSLATATAAYQAGNFVGAVPGPITSAASAGAHRLVRDGVAQLVTHASQIEYRLW